MFLDMFPISSSFGFLENEILSVKSGNDEWLGLWREDETGYFCIIFPETSEARFILSNVENSHDTEFSFDLSDEDRTFTFKCNLATGFQRH